MSGHSDNLQTHSDHVAFVRSILLAAPKYSLTSNYHHRMRPAHPEDKHAEGYLVSGGVTAFTEHVTGRTKQDILDATLFAQLACDNKHDREGEIVEWYNFYNHILGNLGFVIEDFEFQQYQSSGVTFKMDEAVIEILAAIATGGETAVVTAILDAMRRKAQNDHKMVVFEVHSNMTNLGNFQVSSCTQAQDGEVSLSMGAFTFTTTGKQVNFLFFDWDSSDITFQSGRQSAVFNTEVYERVRETISHRLGHKAVTMVSSIRI